MFGQDGVYVVPNGAIIVFTAAIFLVFATSIIGKNQRIGTKTYRNEFRST
jgi:hypothetical protein